MWNGDKSRIFHVNLCCTCCYILMLSYYFFGQKFVEDAGPSQSKDFCLVNDVRKAEYPEDMFQKSRGHVPEKQILSDAFFVLVDAFFVLVYALQKGLRKH